MEVALLSGAFSAAALHTVIPEAVWRERAVKHAQRVRTLLGPGMVNSRQHWRNAPTDGWTGLDREHPVLNFLEEYYHIRGGKGTRRLARFSPEVSGGGTLLEGATADDLACGVLHMNGARLQPDGVLYDAVQHFAGATATNATAYLWYRDVMRTTSRSEPVLHCYGLHEWAMQYHPDGALPPPSSKFQRHLALRVSRETINAVVERRGIACTHVDALRFFAPAAAPLNAHGATLRREQQLELEQPGCVHAHMDLLKMALRLSPWVASELVGDALEVALAARTLDVAASPYDVTSTYGIEPVCIETPTGRLRYRHEQEALMAQAQPVRERLLDAYDAFLHAAFSEPLLHLAVQTPSADRFAMATPGGKPWRRSLIPTSNENDVGGSAAAPGEISDN